MLKGWLDLKLPSARVGSCVRLKEISSLDFEILQENREKAIEAVWNREAIQNGFARFGYVCY